MLTQLFLNGIIAASIYALVGLGFTIIYNTTRFFHFAHGVVYTAGAYIAYTLSVMLRLPLRQLYISRIKADYDGIPIKTKFAKQAVDTVRKTIEIIEDLGGKK